MSKHIVLAVVSKSSLADFKKEIPSFDNGGASWLVPKHTIPGDYFAFVINNSISIIFNVISVLNEKNIKSYWPKKPNCIVGVFSAMIGTVPTKILLNELYGKIFNIRMTIRSKKLLDLSKLELKRRNIVDTGDKVSITLVDNQMEGCGESKNTEILDIEEGAEWQIEDGKSDDDELGELEPGAIEPIREPNKEPIKMEFKTIVSNIGGGITSGMNAVINGIKNLSISVPAEEKKQVAKPKGRKPKAEGLEKKPRGRKPKAEPKPIELKPTELNNASTFDYTADDDKNLECEKKPKGKPTLYFIREGESDIFKIGITKRLVSKRLGQLQTGNSRILNIYRTIPYDDYAKLEKFLHDMYSAKHLHGEWFSLTAIEVDSLVNFLTSQTS